MKSFFMRFKKSKDLEVPEEVGESYIEIDAASNVAKEDSVHVRPFILTNFESVKPVVDSLREGNTIALLNIKPLKENDIVELKRAINKVKKTCDAVEGDIAGFGEDWIAVTPKFAKVFRPPRAQPKPQTYNEEQFSDF